jgi:hypothetical protein
MSCRSIQTRTTIVEAPMFTRLNDWDLPRLQRLIGMFPPYSDHQPFGLLCWNTEGDGEYALLNGNLAFKLRQYSGDGYYVTFIGTREIVKTVRQLLRFAERHPDIDPVLQRVPEIAVRHAHGLRDRYQVAAAISDYDYVFGIPEMAALRGADYGEKRTAINRLQAETAAELRQVDPTDRHAQRLMLDIFDRWAEMRGIAGRTETGHERRALLRLFELSRLIGPALIALALFDGAGTPIGFCTAEVLTHGYAIGHFEKADPGVPGASALMRQRIANYLHARGCRYLNAEQDLGDAGLRTSKLSWAPRFYLRKFTIADRS